MTTPPFRFQGGCDIDGFPTVDGTPRPLVVWVIEFDLGDGWKNLGLGFLTRGEAEQMIDSIRHAWGAEIQLRVSVKPWNF